MLAAPVVAAGLLVELLVTARPGDSVVGVVLSALLAAIGVGLLGRRPGIAFPVICLGMTLAAATAGGAVESATSVPLTGFVSAAATGYAARGAARIIGLAVGTVLFTAGLLLVSGDAEDLIGVVAVLIPAVAGAAVAQQRDATAALRAQIERLRSTTATRAQNAVDAERERVAGELRGVLVASTDAMLAGAQEAAAHLPDAPERATAALLEVERTGRGVMLEVRQVLGVLRSPSDEPAGPARGLDGLEPLTRMLRERGASVTLTDHRAAGTGTLTPGLDLTAYRIVQSSCHGLGPRTSARIAVRRAEGRLELRVEHDGPEPTTADVVALRVRTELQAGTLTLITRDGRTVLHASLPTGTAT